LLKLWDEANGCIPDCEVSTAWLEFTVEAERWGVDVTIARSNLERLVESSTEVMERERHRRLHSSDFERWGRRGGMATLRRYGTDWFTLLALRRWNRITDEDLDRARPIAQGLEVKDD
jgi:hypothetical protein